MHNRNVPITKEQLTEWVSQLDSDGHCDATDLQLTSLIRQSLVAIDSEPVAECQHEWRYGGANTLQNQKQCVKCGRVELVAQPAPSVMQSEPATADCDPEVYEKGVSVCLVAIPKETAEVICQNITAATGCKVDWHYFGGRVHIKAIRVAQTPEPAMDSEPVAFIDKSWTLVYYQPPMNLGIKIGDNLYRHAQPARDSCAIADVIAERIRQQSVEGFSTEQDDTYVGCQLAAAAICYIEPMEAMSYWPADWHDDSFKPTNERRNLVKAAALIIAEIERLDRKSDAESKNE